MLNILGINFDLSPNVLKNIIDVAVFELGLLATQMSTISNISRFLLVDGPYCFGGGAQNLHDKVAL